MSKNTDIAHELRTPLTTILGYIQLLEKKIEDPKQKEWVMNMHRECLRLQSLIENHLSSIK